jgi:hypothetical protein
MSSTSRKPRPRRGLNQPKVSALCNYKLEGFSVERLMTLLNALDQDVEIIIRAKRVRARRRGSAWWRGEAVIVEQCGYAGLFAAATVAYHA